MDSQLPLWGGAIHPAGFYPAGTARPTGVSNSPQCGLGFTQPRVVGRQVETYKKHVRNTDPETSVEAAKKTVRRISVSKQKVLDVLALHPEGLCDEQIAVLTQLKESSASKRRGDLVNQGLVVYAGFTCLTSTNSIARVWRLA